MKKKRGRPPGSKNKIAPKRGRPPGVKAKKAGRPVDSKNKVNPDKKATLIKSSEDTLTLGQLALRIMDCMIELRRIADGLSGAYQSISQLTVGINDANNRIVKQILGIESKVAEIEKLVLGKMPSLEDNGDVEQ